jgi:hypothetical protein
MIDREVFGKGEAALIDRKLEQFPYVPGEPVEVATEEFQRYHAAFMREYFYVLRKMFHTFAFDMKEFAVDFHGARINSFIRALTWLTYVQTIVYEMDIIIEREPLDQQTTGPDLDLVAERILSFLRDHDLLDGEIQRCVEEVVTYLKRERRDLKGKAEYSVEEILATLNLKSADLEMLRRILLRVLDIEPDPGEMAIFKRIDRVREVFDDIRDYQEDLEIANFNTVIFLQKIGGKMNRGAAVLHRFLAQELKAIAEQIASFDPDRREAFEAIYRRLEKEHEYFLEELSTIPSAV